MRPNTSAPGQRETAQDIANGRKAAAAQLFYFFGGTDAAGQVYDGVLHQNPISALEADPQWKAYLDGVRKDPHAKTLSVVSASRNDPKFPPRLVAELFSNEERDQDPRWFGEVFLAGAAEIHSATGKGLLLPPNHSSLDLVRSAYNLVDHLSDEEIKSLGLFMPENAPKRVLATNLAGILAEAEKAADEPGLTAAQRFFRWAVRKWEDRDDAEEERRRKRRAGGDNDKKRDGNPADLLPSAPNTEAKPAAPAPPHQATATPAPTASTAPPPATPTPAPAAITAPAAEETATNGKAAPTAADADTDLILEALTLAGPAGKAMVFMVRKGQKTIEEAVAFATARKLL